jgi:16S rRNA (guanine(966)-N(2))-methyltransferase RsmD
MRIIAGQFRSRKLLSVPGDTVRPTPDRLREALFNVLAPYIEGAVFLDAYAGSGAVAIEAFSRGAKEIILIEKNHSALQIIQKNLESLKIGREALIVRGNAAAQLKKFKPDIAFVDPPYDQTAAYSESLTVLAENNCPLVIAQHPTRLTLEDRYGALQKFRVLRQGDNSLSFYSPAQQDVDVHDIGAGGTGLDEISQSLEEGV